MRETQLSPDANDRRRVYLGEGQQVRSDHPLAGAPRTDESWWDEIHPQRQRRQTRRRVTTPLYLRPEHLIYHAFFVGASRSGKSRLLLHLFVILIRLGYTVGLIDPAGDLAKGAVRALMHLGFYASLADVDRLVYIDWGNGAYVPFNVLSGPGLPEEIVLYAMDAMGRFWPERPLGVTFERVFPKAAIVLLANGLPLTAMATFLTDPGFRARCLARVHDPDILAFFRHLDQMRSSDRDDEIASTLRRLDVLTTHPAARYTFGQTENVLNFRRFMDAGISFALDLSGIRDDLTRKLIGSFLMVEIERAALSRSDLKEADRRLAIVMVDEWQNFAAQRTIPKVLDESAKFGLRLYLAGQSLSQIESDRLAGAIGGCGIKVAFTVDRESAVKMAHAMGSVSPYAVKDRRLRSIANYGLVTDDVYLSIAEQFEDLAQDLVHFPNRHAYVQVRGSEAVHFTTPDVNDPPVSDEALADLLQQYRQRFQRELDDLTLGQAEGRTDPTSESNADFPWQRF